MAKIHLPDDSYAAHYDEGYVYVPEYISVRAIPGERDAVHLLEFDEDGGIAVYRVSP